ncbi:MAG: hypothetical protein WCD37_21365 [Chloroflexia bacterium]
MRTIVTPIFVGLILSTLSLLAADASPRDVAYAQADTQDILFTEFRVPIRPTFGGLVGDITLGPDNNLWFTETSGRIGRLSTAGQFRMFALPEGSNPWRLATGPDGNLWFTGDNSIGRFTLAGDVTIFPLPGVRGGFDSWDITRGGDGNLWFTEQDSNRIGRITTDGQITEFVVPAEESVPWGITQGTDGNVWFTEIHADKVARITPEGNISEFIPPHKYVWDICAGPDGNMWFTQGPMHSIGRITPDDVITEFNLWHVYEGAYGITAGPDGNIWFTGQASDDFIGSVTPDGVVTEYLLPEAIQWPEQITSGPDGNVWFNAQGSDHKEQKIVRVSRQHGPLAPRVGMPDAGAPTSLSLLSFLPAIAIILIAAGIGLLARGDDLAGRKA